jgi:hypothetical protein
MYQLLWLAALPFVGALSVHLSRRARGDRLTSLIAALSPSIVMVPLWMALAARMSHPSPRQWFGLLCGVLNWIVTPGIALLLRVVCAEHANRKKRDCPRNERTYQKILVTGARQSHSGDGRFDDLDTSRS